MNSQGFRVDINSDPEKVFAGLKFWNYNTSQIVPLRIVVDEVYSYSKSVDTPSPFPCDLYLDRKAWDWLVKNYTSINGKIVFWNIGGEWSPSDGLPNALRGDGIVTSEQVNEFLSMRNTNQCL